MSAPLPTSPEIEKLMQWYAAEVERCYPISLRAAQHAATRKATLEEVDSHFRLYAPAEVRAWLANELRLTTQLGGTNGR